MTRTQRIIHYAIIGLIAAALIASLIAQSWIAAVLLIAPLIYLWLHRSSASAAPTRLPAARRDEPDTYRELLWKNLIFRSNSEIKIAKTLDHRDIFFIPPGRVRMSAGKDGRQSRELDFVICYAGKWGVLEVDGPYHRAKLDAERDALLRGHGIQNIQRFPAERCYNDPNAVIDEFIHSLD